MFKYPGLAILVGAFLASGFLTLTPGSVAPSSCRIKGNISIATGQRIYHIPGQAYYSATGISLAHGERWFKSRRKLPDGANQKSRATRATI